MNVLFAAAECAPFVKVGGLGDVIRALPRALDELGHDVRVVLPHYGVIDDAALGVEPFMRFEMPWNGAPIAVEVSRVVRGGITHYLIRGWPFFAAEDAFVYHADEGMDVGRFLFFCAATLALTRRLAEAGWRPDVYHVHDWHTALLPYLVTREHYSDPLLSAATVFSIHNMRYQGWGVGWHLDRAGLPPVEHGLLQAIDRTDNALAIGLTHSTMLSTVSPRYAEEITTEAGGFGLDGILHARLSRLVGILNGIDVERWDPSAGANLVQPFDAETLDARVANKLALQAELGLEQRADVPLVGIVTRLVDQKGPDILFPAIWHMLQYAQMQFALLGTGQEEYQSTAWAIGQAFPGKAAIRLTFNEPLSERIYAGADVFVMPSLFEPCGLGQMLAMRYGALPVVREVGGLADTVTPDAGFLFRDYSAGALQWALSQALDVYYNRPAEWEKRVRRAMAKDFSWARSAREYENLYARAIALWQRYA